MYQTEEPFKYGDPASTLQSPALGYRNYSPSSSWRRYRYGTASYIPETDKITLSRRRTFAGSHAYPNYRRLASPYRPLMVTQAKSPNVLSTGLSPSLTSELRGSHSRLPLLMTSEVIPVVDNGSQFSSGRVSDSYSHHEGDWFMDRSSAAATVTPIVRRRSSPFVRSSYSMLSSQERLERACNLETRVPYEFVPACRFSAFGEGETKESPRSLTPDPTSCAGSPRLITRKYAVESEPRRKAIVANFRENASMQTNQVEEVKRRQTMTQVGVLQHDHAAQHEKVNHSILTQKSVIQENQATQNRGGLVDFEDAFTQVTPYDPPAIMSIDAKQSPILVTDTMMTQTEDFSRLQETQTELKTRFAMTQIGFICNDEIMQTDFNASDKVIQFHSQDTSVGVETEAYQLDNEVQTLPVKVPQRTMVTQISQLMHSQDSQCDLITKPSSEIFTQMDRANIDFAGQCEAKQREFDMQTDNRQKSVITQVGVLQQDTTTQHLVDFGDTATQIGHWRMPIVIEQGAHWYESHVDAAYQSRITYPPADFCSYANIPLAVVDQASVARPQGVAAMTQVGVLQSEAVCQTSPFVLHSQIQTSFPTEETVIQTDPVEIIVARPLTHNVVTQIGVVQVDAELQTHKRKSFSVLNQVEPNVAESGFQTAVKSRTMSTSPMHRYTHNEDNLPARTIPRERVVFKRKSIIIDDRESKPRYARRRFRSSSNPSTYDEMLPPSSSLERRETRTTGHESSFRLVPLTSV